MKSSSFEPLGSYFTFQENPRELQQRIEASRSRLIFIDEIQRIPRLLNSIQGILDSCPGVQFLLSGSSARRLKRGQANLLPGRLFSYQLAPLSLFELGLEWNQDKALSYGTLPGVYSMANESQIKKLLQTYSQTYLKEEIQAEALVRRLDGFVRFLRQAAIGAGGYLDYSKLSRIVKVPRQTVVRYYEVLEDTLIVFKTENDPDLDLKKVDLVKHPRFYFFDVGVLNALRGGFQLTTDRVGPLWEHLVFNQIINTKMGLDKACDVFNFRTRGGFEIDFIVNHDGKKFAVECKSDEHLNSKDFGTFAPLAMYYPRIEKIIVYRGRDEKKENGIWAVPLPKALTIMGLCP